MTHILRLLALAAFLSLGLSLAAMAQNSPVVRVPSQDTEMAEAVVKARATLPQFWEKVAKPGPQENGFSLKVAFPSGANSTEHIWTRDVEQRDGKIFGIVDNASKSANAVQLGQRIEIADERISGWMYRRSGKIVGGYTIRPLLKRMPPTEAERFRAMLEEP
jgi:uncharacterized protein YegJ (DUF2314 family)